MTVLLIMAISGSFVTDGSIQFVMGIVLTVVDAVLTIPAALMYVGNALLQRPWRKHLEEAHDAIKPHRKRLHKLKAIDVAMTVIGSPFALFFCSVMVNISIVLSGRNARCNDMLLAVWMLLCNIFMLSFPILITRISSLPAPVFLTSQKLDAGTIYERIPEHFRIASSDLEFKTAIG
jgi:hypothetical protein